MHLDSRADEQLDDMTQDGFWGLLGAVNSFDRSKKCEFEKYCRPRIKGAILDGRRRKDWTPQLVRKSSYQMEEACLNLSSQLGRMPSDTQIASKMQISIDKLQEMKQVGSVKLIPFKYMFVGYDEDGHLTCAIEDPKSPEPSNEAEKHEIWNYLANQLAGTEFLIIYLKLFESMSFAKIAQILTVPPEEIFRVYISAIEKVKESKYP